MNHGIPLAISSDILPIGPMVGLYAAVTRKGMSGRVFAEDEAISMMEALQAYTLFGAYLSFEENRKGSIEPGKQADLVSIHLDELSTLPMFDAVSQIVYAAARAQVRHVWVDGQMLLSNGELTTLDADAIAARTRAWLPRMGTPYVP